MKRAGTGRRQLLVDMNIVVADNLAPARNLALEQRAPAATVRWSFG